MSFPRYGHLKFAPDRPLRHSRVATVIFQTLKARNFFLGNRYRAENLYSSLLFAKCSESEFKLDASLLLKKLLAPKVANLFKRK